ncbi:MAG: hypothetical protein GY717_03395 [Rhodobacteraceae bacterium]|nr:hypothetical protein [Paracoccaceae bacterium]
MMQRTVLSSAFATGFFPTICASLVDLVTDAQSMWQIAVAAVCGFAGDLFAALVIWGRR